MIPTCRDEISTRPAETDFTRQLHVEIKFCQQLPISSCHLLKASHALCLPEHVNKFSGKHFILNKSINRSF